MRYPYAIPQLPRVESSASTYMGVNVPILKTLGLKARVLTHVVTSEVLTTHDDLSFFSSFFFSSKVEKKS